uniref:SAM domain-containing protein n=1 Tax=Ascaris lumbricoides TaxID=6252 RepID=A0A9J2P344_ASCLU
MTVQRYQIVSHRPMCFWSAMDTEEWLKRKRPKLAFKYAHLFIEHYISGRILVEITDDQLMQIGVDDFEERQDLLLEIRKQKLFSDLDEVMKLSARDTPCSDLGSFLRLDDTSVAAVALCAQRRSHVSRGSRLEHS